MTDFEGVAPPLQQALTQRGYTELTPVQTAILALENKNADALVSAQTGSGKTVAFGLALAPTLLDGADRFARADAPLALAVAPTRELALQVRRELEWLYAPTGAAFASCVGGMDARAERMALQRGAHIVVGTPGRLRDHIERGSFNTTGLKAVVLDEADEMLDLGFRDDLEFILDAAPADRRTLLFSATVPRTIANLAKRYQRDAIRVSTSAEQSQHVDIEYRALTVAPNDAENAIVNVLRYFDAKNALVFCGTRAAVNRMTSRFANRGFSAVALSGELSQNERTHALQALRDGRARVCIATDVAARGLDLPNLELVIHADIPKNRESLLHRSGRTGRAGRKGVCALIVPHNMRRRTERLLKNAHVEATWANPPSAQEIMQRDRERIFTDPALSEPLNDEERAFAKELLSHHDAEHIAAAFLRRHLEDQTAPEELLDAAPTESREPRKDRRDNFQDSVWFTLSVGRDERAEARWLMPMLCRAGHLTKQDIGAIRIQASETHVELAAGCVDRFLEGIGPGGKVEKNIVVTRRESDPTGGAEKPPESNDKPYVKKKPYTAKPRGEQASGGSRNFGDKPYSKKKPYNARPHGEGSAGASHGSGDKPYAKKKPYNAKPRDDRAQQGGKRHFDPRSDVPSGQAGQAGPGDNEKMPWEAEEKKPWVKKGKKSSKKSATKKSQKGKLGLKAPKMSAKARAAIDSGHAPMKRKKPKRDRV
ncbi:MAG: DEAD/DEAH box helicase [Rhodospirillaceae bacterium]|nr:DEAD/DEAH box helicase [Rhodospirillaceae bacterium]